VSRTKVQCLNPEVHGTQTHLAGSAAAIACTQTRGKSTKMSHIVAPPRQSHKGNNIGNVSVLTNISEESLNWSKEKITRKTPQDVASLIDTVSSNSNIRNNHRDFAKPFVALVHDEDYADEFGDTSILPNPHDLGFGFVEPNDQAVAIINAANKPGFDDFISDLAKEMDTDSASARGAYEVISGYLSDEDKAKVYAVGCLRSQYLDRKDEMDVIKAGMSELEDIFNSEVDDGTKMAKHGISFADGAGVQFTTSRKFNYDDAAPIPLDDLADDDRAAAIEANKERLSPDKYQSIIKSYDPKYLPLAQVEKVLEKADFKKFVGWGSTSLSVK
jgi:hypothetical protein